jgi:hypothetical protein
MHIEDAQRDVRATFLGGFAGQLVSGMLWAAAAALGTWGTPRLAILLLVVGGVFIFPLTRLVLAAMGRPTALPNGHPMNGLAMQIAFIMQLNLPVVAAATLYRLDWFHPAMMVVLGTHYLPFVFLYGMRQFAALAGILILAGVGIARWVPGVFALGGWVTAVLLVAFALTGRLAART